MATTTAPATATTIAATAERRAYAGLWSDALWRLRRDRVTIAAFAVLGVLVLFALAADVLAENAFQTRFEAQELLKAYAKPTLDPPAFALGADEIGRSQVVRLLYGGRVSLAVAGLATLITLTIGIAVGLSAGYFRGVWDDLVTWFITTLQSIPQIYLLLIFAGLFQPDATTLIFVLGLLIWPGLALYVRGQTFALREREFVTAARTVGASGTRIMVRHILPNVLPLIFIIAAIDAGTIILIESALSFLGLGIQPPMPSWGNMLTNAAAYFVRAWWLVVSPGVMIFLTVLSLYLIGDGLRDALDPRLRGTH